MLKLNHQPAGFYCGRVRVHFLTTALQCPLEQLHSPAALQRISVLSARRTSARSSNRAKTHRPAQSPRPALANLYNTHHQVQDQY
ncbi:hypothetical protein SRHO_G00308380 [Serrasalmus rhombeus]